MVLCIGTAARSSRLHVHSIHATVLSTPDRASTDRPKLCDVFQSLPLTRNMAGSRLKKRHAAASNYQTRQASTDHVSPRRHGDRQASPTHSIAFLFERAAGHIKALWTGQPPKCYPMRLRKNRNGVGKLSRSGRASLGCTQSDFGQ